MFSLIPLWVNIGYSTLLIYFSLPFLNIIAVLYVHHFFSGPSSSIHKLPTSLQDVAQNIKFYFAFRLNSDSTKAAKLFNLLPAGSRRTRQTSTGFPSPAAIFFSQIIPVMTLTDLSLKTTVSHQVSLSQMSLVPLLVWSALILLLKVTSCQVRFTMQTITVGLVNRSVLYASQFMYQ